MMKYEIRRVYHAGGVRVIRIPMRYKRAAHLHADRILKAYQKRNGAKPSPHEFRLEKAQQVPRQGNSGWDEGGEKPVIQIGQTRQGLKKPATIVPVSAGRSTVYDRYMQAGYQANEKKDSSKGTLFSRRCSGWALTTIMQLLPFRNTESKK
jgi:hypothetical protein